VSALGGVQAQLVDGRIAGTWTAEPGGEAGEPTTVTVTAFDHRAEPAWIRAAFPGTPR
jgi:hypothetical protein